MMANRRNKTGQIISDKILYWLLDIPLHRRRRRGCKATAALQLQWLWFFFLQFCERIFPKEKKSTDTRTSSSSSTQWKAPFLWAWVISVTIIAIIGRKVIPGKKRLRQARSGHPVTTRSFAKEKHDDHWVFVQLHIVSFRQRAQRICQSDHQSSGSCSLRRRRRNSEFKFTGRWRASTAKRLFTINYG